MKNPWANYLWLWQNECWCFQASTVMAKWILKRRCWWALCHRLKGGLRIGKRGAYVYQQELIERIDWAIDLWFKGFFASNCSSLFFPAATIWELLRCGYLTRMYPSEFSLANRSSLDGERSCFLYLSASRDATIYVYLHGRRLSEPG